jgi:alcohol dehydrogenase class IV
MSFTLALSRISLSGKDAMADAVEWLAQQDVRSVLLLTDAIDPNPRVAIANAVFAVFRSAKPDAIVAYGGGSVIDKGKAERDILMAV